MSVIDDYLRNVPEPQKSALEHVRLVIKEAIPDAEDVITYAMPGFKYKKKYYMLSSACTGWNPNTAEIAVADSIMGEWTIIGDPCTGPDSKITFYGQSTYVQPIQGKKNAYIALFDMWKKKDLADSRYIWLPLYFDKDGKPEIPWHAEWNFSIFKK